MHYGVIMLHRVFCASSTEKTKYFHDSILGSIKTKRKVLYVVPEQNTVTEEAAIAELSEGEPQFFCEVTNFSRLCNLVFRKYGSLSFRPITKTGKLLILSKALKGMDTPILNVRFDRPGAVERLLTQLEELHDFGISPDGLDKLSYLAQRNGDDRLEKKLNELSGVFRLYLQLLDSSFDHQASETKKMLEILSKERFFEDYIIYIDGFYDFTADQYAVIRRMAVGASELYVGLFADKKLLSSSDSFAIRPIRAAKKLSLMCPADGIRDHFLSCDSVSPELEFLADNLLTPTQPSPSAPQSIKIFRCPTAQEEVIHAARTIRELVSEGMKYQNIAVTFRNDGIYPTLCEKIFPSYGIPLHSSVKKDPSNDPLIRATELACRIACGDRRLKLFRKYIKTDLCGLDTEESFALENYALTWDLNGRAWYKGFVMPPNGYGSRFDDEQRTRLATLEATRQKLLAPLISLEDGLKKATVREKLLAVTAWLKEVKAYESITASAELLRQQGDFSQADQKLNLWNDFIKALLQIDLTLGDTEADNSEFCDCLKLALRSCSIGTLPPAPDCVQVGEAAFMRSGDIKALMVLGVNSGVFPAEDQQSGILTPFERSFFKDNDMELSPDGAQSTMNEYFIFQRLIRTPTQVLILSYRDRKSSASGSGETPSVFISNVKALFPELEEEIFDSANALPLCHDEAIDYFCSNYRKKNPLTDLLYQRLSNYPLIDKLEKAEDYVDSKQELTKPPYSSPAMTQSRIEKYVNCRYSYFAEYLLKLRSPDTAFFDHADNGNMVHSLLERFFSQMYSEGINAESFSPDEVKQRAIELCRELIPQDRYGDISDRNKIDYLIEQTASSLSYAIVNILKELSQSEFVPVMFEASMPGDLKPYRIPLPDNTELTLYGCIDRVDLYKAKDGTDYLRVIDYKSSSREFSVQDVYNGLSQQMLIYLFAACNGRLKLKNANEIDPQPAGIMYVTASKPKISATDDMTSEQIEQKASRSMARSGLVLDDPEIIEATDSQRLGLILPKGSPSKFLAKMEEFSLLEKHTRKQLTKLAMQLKKGIISPNPFKNHHDSCQYCRFASVCKMQSRPTRPYVLFDRIEDVYQQMKEEQP